MSELVEKLRMGMGTGCIFMSVASCLRCLSWVEEGMREEMISSVRYERLSVPARPYQIHIS